MNVSFLVNLLLLLIVACIVLWAVRSILAATGVGEPISTIVYVVIVLIVLIAILQGGLLRHNLLT